MVKDKVFPLNQEHDKDAHFLLLFNRVINVLARAIWQTSKSPSKIEKEKGKLSLFACDMI